MKHTPGPWTAKNGQVNIPDRSTYSGAEPRKFYIGYVCTSGSYAADDTFQEEQIHTARLIAAAPDLLAAARFAYEAACIEWRKSGMEEPNVIMTKLAHAIAKAEGIS